MEFNHKPVLLDQCISGLNIKADGIYVDGTLGGAGHSREIVKKINGFKPNSRVDFSITKFGNKIYLFGGVSSKIYNELWTYNIDTNKWDKIIYDEKEKPIPRKGHTSVIIKNTIFIFGGESPKDATYEDLVTYNIILIQFYYFLLFY